MKIHVIYLKKEVNDMSRKKKKKNRNYDAQFENKENKNNEPKVEEVKTEIREKVEDIRPEATSGYKVQLGKKTNALDIREKEYPVSAINQMLDNQNQHWETIMDFIEAKLVSRGLVSAEQYEQIENEVLGEIAYLSKKYS